MKQGLLAFQYEQEKGSTGMTGLSGLMTYMELMQAAGLRSSVERHVRLRERGQGWTDSQMITSLMLLNLAGGESVSDLDLLEKDRGLCRMLREFETCGMRLSERRALEKRWRVERRRSVPSESAVFRPKTGCQGVSCPFRPGSCPSPSWEPPVRFTSPRPSTGGLPRPSRPWCIA